ncbi:hypothetical protein ON058_02885 [Demequina sp. B12]|uniref:hypothetical protein n=1 Tax=Demequina sp. B12 TaxID=2992757 RepID=UPI00237BCF8C|nr:hypothetical protein [Demequina sp. B12]MDE0572356.1 hypothetical protein [Demequina sp. B12]
MLLAHPGFILEPEGTGMAVAPNWFGIVDVVLVLRADGRTVESSLDPFLSAEGNPVPVVFRRYVLPEGWGAEDLRPIVEAERERAAAVLPEEYVRWSTEVIDSYTLTPLPVFPHSSEDPSSAWESAGPAVVTSLQQVFGKAIQFERARVGSGAVQARLFEAFELEIAPLDRAATCDIRIFVDNRQLTEQTWSAMGHRYRYPRSWQAVELVERLTDVRTWCVKVLPEDFLARLEQAYGPLPGVSGPDRVSSEFGGA